MLLFSFGEGFRFAIIRVARYEIMFRFDSEAWVWLVSTSINAVLFHSQLFSLWRFQYLFGVDFAGFLVGDILVL